MELFQVNGRPHGKVVHRDRGGDAYEEARKQYATSSVGVDPHLMRPASIFFPRPLSQTVTEDDTTSDVIAALQYAKDNNAAVAIVTGGHQYCGLSSTTGNNIQLNLRTCYTTFQLLQAAAADDAGRPKVRVGVSHSLDALNRKLRKHGLFVPHGQCSHVHVGGHVQTGGYGQLGRAFGLLGDHVVSFDIITCATAEEADAAKARGEAVPDFLWRRGVTSAKNPELFFAVLGGGPGNFGVLTHVTLSTHRATDHPYSRGFKGLYTYNENRLRRLLDVMVEFATDDHLPADYDVCVTVMSPKNEVLAAMFPKALQYMKDEKYSGVSLSDELIPFAMIVAYVQWSNLHGHNQPYDPSIVQRIKDAGGPHLPFSGFDDDVEQPMTVLTKEWIYREEREFRMPFVKRTYSVGRDTLTASPGEWAKGVAHRIDEIAHMPRDYWNNLNICSQIQYFGGRHSKFRTLGLTNGTAFCWRDTAIVCVMDAFYREGCRQEADDWQRENDAWTNPRPIVVSSGVRTAPRT